MSSPYFEFSFGSSRKKPVSFVAYDENDFDDLPYPTPLSATWRLTHCACYIIGASAFAIGSALYFPVISDYNGGGWLFTIGSAVFAYADFTEWWTNNRVGCFYYKHYQLAYEATVGRYFDSPDTPTGRYQRAENGINCFFSLFGSTLYLIGSILFIPAMNGEVAGTYLFIFGSVVICLSQLWKLYRAGCRDEDSPINRHFQLKNLSADIPAFIIDASEGLGGLAYLLGSILFLSEYDVDRIVSRIAACWFEVGSLFYIIATITLFYHYFLRDLNLI